jgi:hypothetical protein
MRRSTEGDVPQRLKEFLDAIVDRELATRLTDTITAAGKCIERLAAINLVALEPQQSEEGSADLSLWETMAPAVGETVVAVNELCAVIDESFPPVGSRQSVFGHEGSDQRAELEAGFVFRTISPLLKKEVVEVGQLMRRPELMSSAWALLTELQRLRSGLRQRVSDAVYLAAAALAPVGPDEVVPGMQQETMRALSFRATESALRKTLTSRLERPGDDGGKLAKNLDEDFAVFTAMPAWRHVEIPTKRMMLQVRERLKSLAMSRDTRPEQCAALLKPLIERLATTSETLSKTVLARHDRRAYETALLRVEQALLHLDLGTGAGGWALEAALNTADVLRGRSQALDEVLRRASRQSVVDLSDDELRSLAAELSAELGWLDL